MKILFVNPWVYTSETRNIKRKKSIKDTMSYGLCTAFAKKGHDITLVEDINFKPVENEDYLFKVKYVEPKLKGIFVTNKLPWYPEIKEIIERDNYDLIICSEAFFTSTFTCVRKQSQKTIVWQELALFQKAFFKIPAKLWYSIIVKYFYKNVRIVSRSLRAKGFISNFSKNVSSVIIDHGVNLEEFVVSDYKKKQFIVISQLITRKRIDKTILAFEKFHSKYDSDFKLIIIGDGEQRNELEKLALSTNCSNNIEFKGFLSHDQIVDDLSKSYALLVSTSQDNNILTINEAVASGCPVLTNMVPYMSEYVKEKKLGIAKEIWDEDSLYEIVKDNDMYRENCIRIREELSYFHKVELFEKEWEVLTREQ